MDKLSKPEVMDAVKRIREVVESTGLEYQGRWDVRYKGLDDYLYHKVAKQA